MLMRTFGIFAALGVGITSLAVWAATPPPAPEPLAQQTPGGLLMAEGPTSPSPLEPPPGFTVDGTLAVSARLGHPVMAAERTGETYLLARLTAAPDAWTDARPPVSLAIVIDRSGSMRGKRLTNALAAARSAIEGLAPGDVVSVITYEATATTVVPPTAMDSASRARALASLGRVAAGGNTCISCALEAAEQALLSGSSGALGGQRVSRVLLLTDGEPTRGVLDVAGFERLSERLRDRGIPISTVGVDVEYNERILSAIARTSNGRHYFVEHAASLPKIFEEERQALAQTVAKDTELVVTLAPGVTLGQVYDRRYRQEAGQLIIPIGALSRGEERSVLLRLELPSGAVGEERVADVSVSYDDVAQGGRGQARGGLSRALSLNPEDWSPLDAVVSARLLRSETAQVLLEANQLVATGQVGSARTRLSAQLAALEAKRGSLPKAEGVSDDLARQASALAKASDGFATAPEAKPGAAAAAGPAPAAPKKARAQTRANAEQAAQFGY